MRHEIRDDGTVIFTNDKDETAVLSNFFARIIEEHRYIDDKLSERYYIVEGEQNGEKLSKLQVRSEDFASMNWAGTGWGSQVIIFPGGASRERLRTIIQMESSPAIRTIYTNTGWQKIDGKQTYLTDGVAINEKTRRTDIELQIPHELRCYRLPEKSGDIRSAFNASLAIPKLITDEIGWLIIGALYRVAIGPADFCIHITGRSGTFKSEIAALAQSHFGEVDARQLPVSWSSTANALEALAYRARNAIIVIDDFIPAGTSYQQKAYQKTADQIIRGQGNQAGRARLTDRSMMQATMYPRGLIMSTGEDTPEGHSVRGRMMIGELSPGDIQPKDLTTAQDARGMYAYAMASYIQWLANDLKNHRAETKDHAEKIRNSHLTIGHPRTPQTLGHLIAGIFKMLQWATESGHISTAEANEKYAHAEESLTNLATRQIEYIQAADPVEQFISTLRGIFAVSAGHIKGMNGGPPKHAAILGWSTVGDQGLEWKCHGPRLGWLDQNTSTIYLDAAVAYEAIRRHSRGTITITRQTLYKRLREAGMLSKWDETRQRNTIRIQAEGAGRMCLALAAQTLTEEEN